MSAVIEALASDASISFSTVTQPHQIRIGVFNTRTGDFSQYKDKTLSNIPRFWRFKAQVDNLALTRVNLAELELLFSELAQMKSPELLSASFSAGGSGKGEEDNEESIGISIGWPAELEEASGELFNVRTNVAGSTDMRAAAKCFMHSEILWGEFIARHRNCLWDEALRDSRQVHTLAATSSVEDIVGSIDQILRIAKARKLRIKAQLSFNVEHWMSEQEVPSEELDRQEKANDLAKAEAALLIGVLAKRSFKANWNLSVSCQDEWLSRRPDWNRSQSVLFDEVFTTHLGRFHDEACGWISVNAHYNRDGYELQLDCKKSTLELPDVCGRLPVEMVPSS